MQIKILLCISLLLVGYNSLSCQLHMVEQERNYFVAGLTEVTLSFCNAASKRSSEQEVFYFTVLDAGSEIYQSSEVLAYSHEPITWKIDQSLKKRFFNDANSPILNLLICVYKLKSRGMFKGPMNMFAYMRNEEIGI